MPPRLNLTDKERDARDLEWLRLRDDEGLSMKAIGERFGVTKNAVIGALNRINKDDREADP